MDRPCPYCDHPDSSLLRVVLIGEIIRADDATLYALADLFDSLGLLQLAEEEAETPPPRGPGPPSPAAGFAW
ncbi:MAG: hypothetical protein KatS3mg131_2998 [Candidatus Tectimicrobiota bacterium]|nr:MAG: hypothetical protein KatS3mg131_2998 [Candidatus Tectomicrobia bacterium]